MGRKPRKTQHIPPAFDSFGRSSWPSLAASNAHVSSILDNKNPASSSPSHLKMMKKDMERTIVADCFVPQRDRFYNEQDPLLVIQPSRVLADSEKQTMFLRQHFAYSVPLIPHALVRASAEALKQTLQQALQQRQQQVHQQQQQQQQQYFVSVTIPQHNTPLPLGMPSEGMPLRSLDPDTHFAVKYQQLMRLAPPTIITAAGLEQQFQSLLTYRRDGPLPSLQNLIQQSNDSEAPQSSSSSNTATTSGSENNNTIAKYCDTLEELLFEERRENLMLFERYSQYHYDKIGVSGSRGGEQSSSCWVELEGIADAQPAVQVGDILLLRPCEMARKKPTPAPYNPYLNPYPSYAPPHHPPHTQHQHQQQQGPSYGVVEVQAQVLSVTRANARHKVDRIHVTWPEEARMLQFGTEFDLPANLIAPQALPPNHNIRIVPNPRPLVRCLTAVDWLRSTLVCTMNDQQQQPQPQSLLNEDFNGCTHLFQELLFPTKAPILPAVRDDDVLLPNTRDQTELNAQQFSFVRLMLQRTLYPSTEHIRGPLILTGPAGTGKTRTMLSGIQRILALNSARSKRNGPRVRVLVCTPSHTAANVITKGLGKFLQPSQLFRLLDASRPVNTIPNELSPFYRQDPITGAFCLPSAQELLNFDVIVSTCLDAHLLYLAGCTNQQLRLHRTSTYRNAQQQLYACGVELGESKAKTQIETFPHFTHLLLDEAAQATEAESLVPLSVVADPVMGVQKVEVVLVGDPRQLSPQVFSEKAMEAGFGCSWMERLLRQPIECTGGGHDTLLGEDQSQIESLLRYSLQSQSLLSVFLTMNYRGHPSFLSLPSALFYSDLLQSAPPHPDEPKSANDGDLKKLTRMEWLDKLRMVECLASPVFLRPDDGGDNIVLEELLMPRKQFAFPIHFRGVIGKDVVATVHMGFTGNSWMNREEADAVVEIVKTLTSNDQQNGNVAVDPRSIGVCSPFRGQVDLIRKLLRQEGLASIDVGTIEDYQAVEWDVIILSLTRSTQSLVASDIARRMGVFGQPKRSNVALTRAESLFIVVGNPNTSMADYFVWRQFLLFCYRNGLWYGDKNDTENLPSDSVVATNLEELIEKKQLKQSPTPLSPSSSHQPPAHTHHNGVIISSLERLLRASNIV
ncbi:hypothetical protein ACA910_006955 [Epithemia clementina (nom. ined.)]